MVVTFFSCLAIDLWLNRLKANEHIEPLSNESCRIQIACVSIYEHHIVNGNYFAQ